VSFLVRWLSLGKDRRRVGLRPHRDVELAAGYDAAYDRVLQAIELALGAYISVDDRRGGTIEAAFGLVNNERVRCTLQRVDDGHTAVRVEAFFPAGAEVRDRSAAVEALATMLEAPASA
jgi:hypothetical protein